MPLTQKGLINVLDTIIKKLAQKHINKAHQEGYKEGYGKALIFSQEYYEGKAHDKCIKSEVDKVVKSQQTEIDKFRELDSFLTWAKIISDISDSDYFKLYVFELNTIEEIKNLLEYIDYLSKNLLIKEVYPEIHEYLFELHISIKEVLENKLLLEEANKIIGR